MSGYFKPVSMTKNSDQKAKILYYIFLYKIFVVAVILVAIILSTTFFASTLSIIEYKDFGDILENHDEEIGTVDAEGSSTTSGVTVAPGENGYQFYQDDYGDVKFGESYINKQGCGITSMAMCVSDLLGHSIDPRQLASEFNINPYWVNPGVSWKFFNACAEHYGLQCQELGTDSNAVVQALKEGKKVISSQRANLDSPFISKGGHIIYFYGLDSSGNIVVKDPYRYNVDRGLVSHSWNPSEICSWSANNFAIWK